MARINLSDRFIGSDKRRPQKGRLDYPDAQVPGLALRATATGHKSFVLIARYPLHPKNPTRRVLYGAITLEQARDKARQWLALIQKGIDPKVQEARDRAAEQRKQVNTFRAVAAEFLDRHASGLAKAADARHVIEHEFVKRWGARPVTDIKPEECAAAIRAIVNRGAPYQAHNALGYLRRLYTWAIGTHEFGVTASPVAALRPVDLIGKRQARDRVLTDDELRAVWMAELGYPYGPLIRLMILTGQREREIADMAWSEVDFGNAVWTIPAARMKGGRTHVVPLAPDALALLRALPRFAGAFVFTTTAGAKPVNGFSKVKARLDKLSGVSAWVLHDLRRSMRTHLSALAIEDRVREQMIAHAQPGLHRVYDQHAYSDEKRRGFQLWEQRLRGILNPAPLTVADITAERGRRRESMVA
jgi:integrase